MVCGCGACFRVVVAAGYGFVTCCVFGCGSGFLMFVFCRGVSCCRVWCFGDFCW